jgi:hypothetical protein
MESKYGVQYRICGRSRHSTATYGTSDRGTMSLPGGCSVLSCDLVPASRLPSGTPYVPWYRTYGMYMQVLYGVLRTDRTCTVPWTTSVESLAYAPHPCHLFSPLSRHLRLEIT